MIFAQIAYIPCLVPYVPTISRSQRKFYRPDSYHSGPTTSRNKSNMADGVCIEFRKMLISSDWIGYKSIPQFYNHLLFHLEEIFAI